MLPKPYKIQFLVKCSFYKGNEMAHGFVANDVINKRKFTFYKKKQKKQKTKTITDKPYLSKQLLTKFHVASKNRTALKKRCSSPSLSGTPNKISSFPPQKGLLRCIQKSVKHLR